MAQIIPITDTTMIAGKTVNVIPAQSTKCYRVSYDLHDEEKSLSVVYGNTLVTRSLGALFAFTTWEEVQAQAVTLGLTGLPSKDPAAGS